MVPSMQPARSEAGQVPARIRMSFPDLLMQLGPVWLTLLAAVGAALWLMALRRVIRDARRAQPAWPGQARCGLPKGPLSPSPLAAFLSQVSVRRATLPS